MACGGDIPIIPQWFDFARRKFCAAILGCVALTSLGLASGVMMMFAASAVSAQTNVPSDWPLIPAGRTGGDVFRLIFLSSDRRNANPADIGTYNTFVQNLAAAGHTAIQPYSEGFRVVGCTRRTDARDNTHSNPANYPGVRIYWLNGVKVADDYNDFYDNGWDNEIDTKNEHGNNGRDIQQSGNYPVTGCANNGTELFVPTGSRGLGSSHSVRVGRPASSAGGPISSGESIVPSVVRPMYGLSEVFRVSFPNTPAVGVPEIRGVAEVGQTLSAKIGQLHDANGQSRANAGDAGYAYTYQWQYVDADGVSNPEDITGATESTYTMTLVNAGRWLRVGVSFRDDESYDEGPLFSNVFPSMGTVRCRGRDVVWCGVLTVKTLNVGLGCRNSSGNHKCSNSARLSDGDFTYAMTDYTITGLFVQSDGTLQLDLDEAIAAGGESLALHVDGARFAFTEASLMSSARRRTWDDSGLNWTINDKVEVKLRDTTRSGFAARCPRR